MFKFFSDTYYPIFEDSSSISVMAMEDFHDYTMVILFMITMFLMIIIFNLLMSKFINKTLLAGQMLELIWTIFPMLILFFIAYPSLFYLYLSDLSISPATTIKVYGAQWYWIYEYADFKNFTYSSYLLSDDDLKSNLSKGFLGWRLLECDTRGIFPYGVEVRIMVTSQDVIHSFAIPGLSLKVDAVPGRLNWMTVHVKRPGVYYGQCAEICGVGHAFMPISIDFVSPTDYVKTIKMLKESM
uniref:Cytochrome c oxidase subunit 2 n=1 Tax=Holarthrothrips indicus TaxID=1965675 RepID=A0A8A5L753_9NEOP|nr:cytochrome c oxidase subunit 2 [Holarthrothrips indicus]